MPTLGYNLNMYVIPIRQIYNLGRSVQISETEVRNEKKTNICCFTSINYYLTIMYLLTAAFFSIPCILDVLWLCIKL